MLPDDINKFEYIFTYIPNVKKQYYFYYENNVYGFFFNDDLYDITQYSFTIKDGMIFNKECSYDYEHYKYETKTIQEFLMKHKHNTFSNFDESMKYIKTKVLIIKRQEKIKNLLNG